MKIYIGVDDSGRGPVIGPMVLAGVAATWQQIRAMKKAGVRDSKKLSANKRKQLAELIKQTCLAYITAIIQPTEIDARVNAGLNMNKLEAIKFAKIINELIKKIQQVQTKSQTELRRERPTVFIDCPSTNIKAWKNYLQQYIDYDCTLIVEHKADAKHVVVGAASIIAKTVRDQQIEKIKKQIGFDFGSGYPSDPLTIHFLEEHAHKFKHAGIFRKSWQTWKNAINKKQQNKLDEFF